MSKKKLRLLLLRLLLISIIISSFEIIGYVGMWYSSPSFDFLENNNYFKIRGMLIGNKNPELFPRYLSLPYLGYIPYPGYKKFDVIQHNEDGYRGQRIPLKKTDKFRILCLGGSTTYGFTVDLPSQTFPFQLETYLNAYLIKDTVLNRIYSSVEVINAGLEAGNSAEELQQYLFKYRYYNADVVIVHSGVNDAFLVHNADPDFQLDYSHARRINFHAEPLSQPARMLLKSYFISFLTIRLFYNDFATNTVGFENQRIHTYCHWSTNIIYDAIDKHDFKNYPFYNNTRSLYSEIVGDSSVLIVFPVVLNNKSEFVKENNKYYEINNLNILLSKQLALKLGAIFVNFEYDSIKNQANWMDDCHLNAEGEKNKAEILFPYIKRILNSMKNS